MTVDLFKKKIVLRTVSSSPGNLGKQKIIPVLLLTKVTDNPMDMSLSKPWGMVEDRKAWWAAVHGAAKSRTRLNHWTSTKVSRLWFNWYEMWPLRGEVFKFQGDLNVHQSVGTSDLEASCSLRIELRYNRPEIASDWAFGTWQWVALEGF